MDKYVLVHGAWHGAWCWTKVAELLEQRGHTVVAPDLPGHGKDPTPRALVDLRRYVEKLCGVLDAQPEPVVLVGHSMGGVVITQAAENRADKVKTLVYLTATLPRDGQSLMDLAEQDVEAAFASNIFHDEWERNIAVKSEAIAELFYGDCKEEDVAWAKSKLAIWQPVLPFVSAVSITEENYGHIPRIYIQCTEDKVISPEMQARMCEAVPCRVIKMPTSHSPFLSAPEELADHLDSL